jgi:dTDP-4-dehydrorhamnose reductase
MQKILLTGRNGQVGSALLPRLKQLGSVTATTRTELDLADPASIRDAVRDIVPTLIINTAAYTAVDKAESEPELAMRINTTAVGILADEAKKIGAAVIHYSTDYVFDGEKSSPYLESDPTHPINLYGESKLAGENALLASGARALVLRTSWVYAATGHNFIATMLRLAQTRDEISVVNDQTGAPTSADDIAAAPGALLPAFLARTNTASPQLLHLAAQGATTWAAFAELIFSAAALRTPVIPIPSSQYPTPARRPKNSLLDCSLLAAEYNIQLPDWKLSAAATVRARMAANL